MTYCAIHCLPARSFPQVIIAGSLQLGPRASLPLISLLRASSTMAAMGSNDIPTVSADVGVDVGMSADVGTSEMCNGLITIVRAVGVHPKIVDPLIAAALACFLLLLLDVASSTMSSRGLH